MLFRSLRDQLTVLAADGMTALPESMHAPALELWFPEVVLVVEGAARSVAAAHAEVPGSPGGRDLDGRARGAGRADREPGSGSGPGSGPGSGSGSAGGLVRVVAARGSGDDTIAEVAADLRGRRLVVTADRELRARCEAAGASVTGPRWLLAQL